MTRIIIIALSLHLCYLLFTSCKKQDERITNNPKAALEFDTDTVIFDTVFTSVTTITQRFKVYNRNNNAVSISSIRLVGETSSPFRLTVDGEKSNTVNDLLLRGKDSLLILVEAQINPQDKTLPYIITDKVEFVTNGNMQDVDLVAWGQDAYFHYSDSITTNTTWPNDKPHVIYNYVKVAPTTTLTIQPNTKIFMHGGALLYVKGTVNAVGTFENKIEFDDDRIEQYRKDMPGYWYGIVIDSGSTNNQLDWLTIKNAQFGIRVGTPDNDSIPDAIISNTYIANMSQTGIAAFTSDLLVYNCVVHTTIESAVACVAGGYYTFFNCTFANSSIFTRKIPGVQFADYILDENKNPILINDLTVLFANNIVWGTQENEFYISDVQGGGDLALGIQNNLLKTTEQSYNTADNILNQNPMFTKLDDAGTVWQVDVSLKPESPCKDKAFAIGGLTKDIANKTRSTTTPEIGAYEIE